MNRRTLKNQKLLPSSPSRKSALTKGSLSQGSFGECALVPALYHQSVFCTLVPVFGGSRNTRFSYLLPVWAPGTSAKSTLLPFYESALYHLSPNDCITVRPELSITDLKLSIIKFRSVNGNLTMISVVMIIWFVLGLHIKCLICIDNAYWTWKNNDDITELSLNYFRMPKFLQGISADCKKGSAARGHGKTKIFIKCQKYSSMLFDSFFRRAEIVKNRQSVKHDFATFRQFFAWPRFSGRFGGLGDLKVISIL